MDCIQLLTDQVVHEFFSSNLYAQLAGAMEYQGLDGIAHWFWDQSEEEREHGLKMLRHLLDRGYSPTVGSIPAPGLFYTKTPFACFEATLAQELKVTAQIAAIAEAASNNHDHATYEFIQFFVAEQVQEVEVAQRLVQQFALATDGTGLLLLDKTLAQR